MDEVGGGASPTRKANSVKHPWRASDLIRLLRLQIGSGSRIDTSNLAVTGSDLACHPRTRDRSPLRCQPVADDRCTTSARRGLWRTLHCWELGCHDEIVRLTRSTQDIRDQGGNECPRLGNGCCATQLRRATCHNVVLQACMRRSGNERSSWTCLSAALLHS
ncbi:hypothetical protein BR93DRAFT_76826 [Coniochaeta sp. PMI_546]|nr:hypothetical protein BR93DRAFT_76826 [Coniochaeta sp. PMI_546]